MKNISNFVVLLYLNLICLSLSIYDKKLQFNNNKFRIVQVTDLHFGNIDNYQNDLKTNELVRKLLTDTKPDFVAITGDSLSGDFWDQKNQTYFIDNWKLWSLPFEELQIPYGYTTGNHDTQADLNIEELIKLDKTHPFAMQREENHKLLENKIYQYPVTISNYYIRIYDLNKVVFILWFFDSGDHGCEEMDPDLTYGCINSSQIEWYIETSHMLKKELGYLPKGFAFFHIALPEFRDAYNTRISRGRREDAMGCPTKNTFFFDALLELNSVKAVFVGHDHCNDFCVLYFDIDLCYGRKTGYGSYGPAPLTRGVRIIDIDLENLLNGEEFYKQFILQEDGLLIDADNYNKSFKDDFVDKCVAH